MQSLTSSQKYQGACPRTHSVTVTGIRTSPSQAPALAEPEVQLSTLNSALMLKPWREAEEEDPGGAAEESRALGGGQDAGMPPLHRRVQPGRTECGGMGLAWCAQGTGPHPLHTLNTNNYYSVFFSHLISHQKLQEHKKASCLKGKEQNPSVPIDPPPHGSWCTWARTRSFTWDIG